MASNAKKRVPAAISKDLAKARAEMEARRKKIAELEKEYRESLAQEQAERHQKAGVAFEKACKAAGREIKWNEETAKQAARLLVEMGTQFTANDSGSERSGDNPPPAPPV